MPKSLQSGEGNLETAIVEDSTRIRIYTKPGKCNGIGNFTPIVMGALTETLAILMVFRWILDRYETVGCRGEKTMQATMIIWMIALPTGMTAHFICWLTTS